MKTSRNRILTTHVGSLPRTDAVVDLLVARENRAAVDDAALERTMRRAVLDVVRRQVEIGIDVVSDGETSKIGYATYVRDRLSGFSEDGSTEAPKPHLDLRPFPALRDWFGRVAAEPQHVAMDHRPEQLTVAAE